MQPHVVELLEENDKEKEYQGKMGVAQLYKELISGFNKALSLKQYREEQEENTRVFSKEWRSYIDNMGLHQQGK